MTRSKSSHTPLPIAARAGMLRTPDEERISLAKAAILDGFTLPTAIAAYVSDAAPNVGCNLEQARAALRCLAKRKDEVGAKAAEALKLKF